MLSRVFALVLVQFGCVTALYSQLHILGVSRHCVSFHFGKPTIVEETLQPANFCVWSDFDGFLF